MAATSLHVVGDQNPQLNIPTIPCAVVRCGTSRAVILHGEELPSAQNTEQFLYRVVAGTSPADGLGGDHYQLNKIAVVYPTKDQNRFDFRFFQIDRSQERLGPNMECANVASGGGLFALMTGIARPDEAGILRATNAGTGQDLELSVDGDGPVWANDWRVLFCNKAATVETTPEQLTLVHEDGRSIEYWVIERGNVFVLANTAPDEAEPDLIEQLSFSGTTRSLELGSNWQRASMPKVILYSVQERELTRAVIMAACFFNGEMHNSLPGSGAMCLASFLALSHLREVRPVGNSGTLTFQLAHPSGVLVVGVNWESASHDYRIVSTEFVTPVSLLMYGVAVVPAT